MGCLRSTKHGYHTKDRQVSDTSIHPTVPLNLAPYQLPRDKFLTRLFNTIAGRISFAMAARDLTREEVATASGMPEATIRMIQIGEADQVTVSQLATIAGALGGRLMLDIAFPVSNNPGASASSSNASPPV